MELTLGPETSRIIEEKLKEGSYESADELVQAAIHALDDQKNEELDEETLDAIDAAEEAIDQGRVHRWEDVEEQVKSMFARKQNP